MMLMKIATEGFRFSGLCPICLKQTEFVSPNEDFRNSLNCQTCSGGSIPRERALFSVLQTRFPHWPSLSIHESSPENRMGSNRLATECANYVATQFYPGVTLGSQHNGFRCENLELQTFEDASFDIVITQDVMEHVFNPSEVYREVYRSLKPGGAYIHTTPIFPIYPKSQCRAELSSDGSVRHLVPDQFIEYHGNPIDQKGSLVTWHYGYDLPDLIASWTDFSVELVRAIDRHQGILGPLTDVLVCTKPN